MSDLTISIEQLKKLLSISSDVELEPQVAHLLNEYITLFVDEATLRSIEHKKGQRTSESPSSSSPTQITEKELGEVAGCLLLDM